MFNALDYTPGRLRSRRIRYKNHWFYVSGGVSDLAKFTSSSQDDPVGQRHDFRNDRIESQRQMQINLNRMEICRLEI